MVGKTFEEDLCERKLMMPFSYQPFTIAGVKGFLAANLKETVTFINALILQRIATLPLKRPRPISLTSLTILFS